MGKSGIKKVKIVGKKKINRYTLAECEAELARLEKLNDPGSRYKLEILDRKSRLHG